MDGYNVPPVMFDQAEANALITAEKMIELSKDQSLIEQFSNALIKIKSVFRTALQLQSEKLNEKMLVIDRTKPAISSNSLTNIQLAIINRNVLEINYQKKNDHQTTFRKVEPAAIYSYNEIWIMIAWCHLRKDFRAFRLDRIQQYKILKQVFDERNFDLRQYFLSCPDFIIDP